MSRIVITHIAAQGLERCRVFLKDKNPQAAVRAARAIKDAFSFLQTEPEMGRPLNDVPELRELVIPFGGSGYVALYHYEVRTDSVYMLAFRHQKEAGY